MIFRNRLLQNLGLHYKVFVIFGFRTTLEATHATSGRVLNSTSFLDVVISGAHNVSDVWTNGGETNTAPCQLTAASQASSVVFKWLFSASTYM